jgi:hypothetical protein
MLAAIHGIFLLVIAIWLWRRDTSLLHKFYWPALIAKCIAGISLGIIYSTYYETSDTFTFFQLASDHADIARNDFSSYLNFLFSKQDGYYLGEHRTIFYTKITSVLALATGNNYWITSIYFSLLSFFSAWYLSNTIARLFPEYKIAACIAFLFFPSVVFWSSGIIKESLAMAAMFFLAALFLNLWMRERISILSMVLAVVCGIVIFNLKYYYLAAFIPITVSAWAAQRLYEKFKVESSMKQLLLWAGILVCGFLMITFLHPNFSPSRILEVIAFNNKVFMDVCTPDDVIHYYNLKPTWGSMVINAPWAFISGLFRPFVWEANTIFKFITGVENLVLLTLAFFAIPRLKDVMHSQQRLLILAVILYCAVLSIFLALSTPNFGTLARYGAGYLPFAALLVFHHPLVTKLFPKFF